MDRCCAAHGLRLSRIFPLAVPLALELLAGESRSRLIAVETDGATTIAVAADGRLAFARTIEASWSSEPARVGMEVNRSLFYAKQQLGAVVQQVKLQGALPAVADVRERCGAGREIVAGDPSPAEWLGRVAALSSRHPQNLLAGLRRRRQREEWTRVGAAATCWILLASLAALAWNGRQEARAEERRFATLRREEGGLRTERAALIAQDRQSERNRALLQAAADGHRPPVALRTLAGVASLLPAEIRLTDFQVEWQAKAAVWSFRLGGTIAADEDTARSLVAALQDKIAREPWQANLSEAEHSLNAIPLPAGEAGPGNYSFTLGGTLP